MSAPESELPKLKMAPPREAEEILSSVRREQRAQDREREFNLEDSLVPWRVGSVPYLNAVPLTRGLEDQVTFAVPSKLGALMANNELDAALVSISEVLFHDRYDILDGAAIASLGEVYSVIIAHRQPIEAIQTLHCDPASLTSVNLARVLLAELGLRPSFEPIPEGGAEQDLNHGLLIGDRAIDFRRKYPEHKIWDLGAAWYDAFNLPFVYAIWALQRGKDTSDLRRILRDAKDFGLDTLDYLIDQGTKYDREFRKDYLGWHIHYHLGTDEKRGIAKFMELLRKHSGRAVFEPKFLI